MLIDANLLVYAVDELSPHHARAAPWLAAQLGGQARVGLPWLSLGAFIRLTTNPKLLPEPLSSAEAWAYVTDWLATDVAWTPGPGARYGEILGQLVTTRHVTGNLVPDALLAALAIEHGLILYSADSDFARFPETRWVNPLH